MSRPSLDFWMAREWALPGKSRNHLRGQLVNLWSIQTLHKLLNFQQSSVKLRLENSSCWQNVFLLKSPICSHLSEKNEDKFNFSTNILEKNLISPKYQIRNCRFEWQQCSFKLSLDLTVDTQTKGCFFLFSESKLLSSDHRCLLGFH